MGSECVDDGNTSTVYYVMSHWNRLPLRTLQYGSKSWHSTTIWQPARYDLGSLGTPTPVVLPTCPSTGQKWSVTNMM